MLPPLDRWVKNELLGGSMVIAEGFEPPSSRLEAENSGSS